MISKIPDEYIHEMIDGNKLLVYADSRQDIRSEIIHGLGSVGADIFELNEKSRSLEDVFIHLTTESDMEK